MFYIILPLNKNETLKHYISNPIKCILFYYILGKESSCLLYTYIIIELMNILIFNKKIDGSKIPANFKELLKRE